MNVLSLAGCEESRSPDQRHRNAIKIPKTSHVQPCMLGHDDRSPEPCHTGEPGEADHSKGCHGKDGDHCMSLHGRHRATARRADVAGQRSRRVGYVHAEQKTGKGTQIASRRPRSHGLGGIVDDERVGLGEQRNRGGRLEGTSVGGRG